MIAVQVNYKFQLLLAGCSLEVCIIQDGDAGLQGTCGMT